MYLCSIRLDILPLNCRGGCYFFLIKSNQKSSQQKGFLSLQAIAHKAPKTFEGWNLFAGLPCHFITLHAKISYALNPTSRPTVLSAFTRSFSADVLTRDIY